MSEKGLGLLSKLFQSSGEGMMIVNSKGSIEAINPRIKSMFGWAEAELIGHPVEKLIPTHLKEKHEQHRNGYMKKPAVRSMGSGMDLSGLKKNGSTFPIEISLTYLKHEEETLVVAFITDISVRKEQEQKLENYASDLEFKVKERTRELEHLNMGLQSQVQERKLAEKALKKSLEEIKKAEKDILRALEKEKELGELKSRFVSMASHEFRTPLTTIASSANLIRKYPEGVQQDKREKHIERITNSVKNLTGILNDFLSLEKLESGTISTSHSKVSLHEVLDEMIQEMEVTLKKGQEIQCDKNVDIQFETDPHLLKNLLYNLVSNASKYSDEGQSIIIRCTSQKSEIKIEVEDHGIGIPKAEQKNMFERFFRAANVTNIQGTGLGLHIVKKYTDILQGKITFKSEEGKGSIFTVMLPVQPT